MVVFGKKKNLSEMLVLCQSWQVGVGFQFQMKGLVPQETVLTSNKLMTVKLPP